MKKIVALVLSLVMVLGLATTAMAADASYDVDVKDAATMTAVGTGTMTVKAAKAAYVNAAYQMVDGNVAYYEAANGEYYVSCTKDTAGAFVLYYAGTKTEFDTVVKVNEVDYKAVGTEFTNFGKACGQLNNEASPLTKYYTYVNGAGDTVLVAGTGLPVAAGGEQLLVDGKLVAIVDTDLSAQLVAHKWVVEKNAKNEVVAAKCSVCGQDATWVLNKASIPTGADYEAGFGGYLVYVAAVVTPDTDKVESAETFDAGIAMYVGMSVMAAAGSAVVLKKKD